MIPNRIEAYCDLKRLAFLREVEGHISRSGKPANAPVVIAEELDGENNVVVRTWFVMRTEHRDGIGLKAACPPSRIVSRNIRPGEPTLDYDPNNEPIVTQWITHDELLQIQRARDEMLADRERHVIYARIYLDALTKSDKWRANVEHLNSIVAQKDSTINERDGAIVELTNEVAFNRSQIATVQASYAKLGERQSLLERVKVWLRSMLKKYRASWSKDTSAR